MFPHAKQDKSQRPLEAVHSELVLGRHGDPSSGVVRFVAAAAAPLEALEAPRLEGGEALLLALAASRLYVHTSHPVYGLLEGPAPRLRLSQDRPGSAGSAFVAERVRDATVVLWAARVWGGGVCFEPG